MIKNIFKSILMARDFNTKLKMMGTIIPKVKRYWVKLTEVQIGILEYCAFLDIKNFHELENLTKIEKPSIKYFNYDIDKITIQTIIDYCNEGEI